MDTNECKVSVIIPAHNSEKTISYCLKKIISESNKLKESRHEANRKRAGYSARLGEN